MRHRSSQVVILTLLLCASQLHAQTVGSPSAVGGLPPTPSTEEQISAARMVSLEGQFSSLLRGGDEGAGRKLSGALRELYAAGSTRADFDPAQYVFGGKFPFKKLYQSVGKSIIVDITVTGDLSAAEKDVREIPDVKVLATAWAPGFGIVSAAIPANRLIDVARLGSVAVLSASAPMKGSVPADVAMKQIPEEALKRGREESATTSRATQGSASNQAYTVLGVDDVNRVLPAITGAGIWIGTLSDSADQRDGVGADGVKGFAESTALGDLPAASRIVSVGDYTESDATDEGRAMMELIYDLAPGTGRLGFGTAFVGGQAGFAANITALHNGLMDVINDDVVYADEPYYQDGVIATAVTNHINNEGTYLALNHNYGNLSCEMVFNDSDSNNFHNYSGGDEVLQVTLGPNSTKACYLQWSQPWGGATTNLQLQVWDSSVTTLLASSSDNTTNPVDAVTLANTGNTPLVVNIAVARLSGSATGLTFKYQIYDNGVGSTVMDEYNETQAGTLTPHAGHNPPMAIGAAYYANPGTAESYSGRGPHRAFFPSATTYTKPDFLSIDGCDTSFFGGDSDGNGKPNFFGTSAATPNAAAVAALMLQAAGGPGSLSQDGVEELMRRTAVGLGAPGHDMIYGHGRINALGAVLAARGEPTADTFGIPNQYGTLSFMGETITQNGIRTFAFPINRSLTSQTFIQALRTSSGTGGAGFAPQLATYTKGTGSFLSIGYNSPSPSVSYSGTLSNSSAPIVAQVVSQADFGGTAGFDLMVATEAPNVTSTTVDYYGLAVESNTLTGDEPVQYYRFVTPEDLTGDVYLEMNCTPALDGVIAVYNDAGVQIAYADSGFEGVNESLSLQAEPFTGYTVALTSYYFNSPDSFQLLIDCESSPGQPFQQTTPSYIDGVIRPNPVDGLGTFSVVVPRGSFNNVAWYTRASGVQASSDSLAPHTLGLYNSGGGRDDASDYGTLCIVGYGDSGGGKLRYLRLAAPPTGASGPPTISGDAVESEPPALFAAQLSFADQGGNSNDWLALGDGNITSIGEIHYYRFTTRPNLDSGRVDVEVDCTDGLDLAFELYDASGESVDGFIDGAASDGQESWNYQLQNSSTYYLAISSWRDTGPATSQDWLGRYQFSVYQDGEDVITPTPTPTVTPTPTPDPDDFVDTDGDGFADSVDEAPRDPAIQGDFGDADNNGVTNLRDAIVLYRTRGGSTDLSLDMNRDGIINTEDARILYYWSIGQYPLIPRR